MDSALLCRQKISLRIEQFQVTCDPFFVAGLDNHQALRLNPVGGFLRVELLAQRLGLIVLETELYLFVLATLT